MKNPMVAELSHQIKNYYDLGLMGVGTNILGYSNKDVDKAVTKRLQKGNMSSLNCEEVLLAMKLKKSTTGMVKLNLLVVVARQMQLQ